jgi:hypothetical protein
MSDPAPVAAALEAIAACQRLAAQLPKFAEQLDHAASIARAEWTGPHREAFDHRAETIDRNLHVAAYTLRTLTARLDHLVAVPQ